MTQIFRLLIPAILSAFLSGCITYNELVGAPDDRLFPSAVVERLPVTVTADDQAPQTHSLLPGSAQDEQRNYRIDHGDVLLVNVED